MWYVILLGVILYQAVKLYQARRAVQDYAWLVQSLLLVGRHDQDIKKVVKGYFDAIDELPVHAYDRHWKALGKAYGLAVVYEPEGYLVSKETKVAIGRAIASELEQKYLYIISSRI